MRTLAGTAGLVLCLAGLGGCAPQAELMDMERLTGVKRLAVLPFEDGPGYNAKNSGKAVTGFVTAELAKHPKYRLLERSKLKTVIDEQDLQTTSLVDDQTAIRVGKILGVDGVVLGSVSEYEMDKTTAYIYVVPVVSREYRVGATLRIIDVRNSEVIYAHSASANSPGSFTEAGRRTAQTLLAPLPR